MVGSVGANQAPLCSFTPSPLGGEGWGEGPTAHLILNPNTERPA